MVSRTASAALALVALSVVGCGDDQPVTEQVRETIEAFGEATAGRDYQAICDDLLARELVANVEQVGLPCELAWQRGLGEVQAPELEIRSVVVNEDEALAEVTSTARGQEPSQDTLALERTGTTWRITSLAQAQPQPPENPRP